MKQKSFTKRGRVRPICDESSRKPKNQKTKTFWRSFGFRSKDVFFWFSLSFFVFFWFRFLKTKKNLVFFWFFEGSLSWSKAKNQKNSRFFLVFSWILHTFLLNIWPKKTKNLEFFWFFALLQLRLPSKNQKNPSFFLVFKNLNQKKPKKLKENQKKPSFDLKPKLLQKVLVFWFFGFLEVSSHSLFLFGRNSGSRIESVFHGNIYKIVVVGYNLCYLGSTCEKLSKRMERHRADYKNLCRWKETFYYFVSISNEYGKT